VRLRWGVKFTPGSVRKRPKVDIFVEARRLLELSLMRAITFLILLTGLACGAEPRFGGTWVATFKGTPICTLEIEEKDDRISGVTRACNISVDQNGDLIEGATPDSSEPGEPFLHPRVDGSILKYEQDDDGKPIKFELKLTAEGKAELRIVDSPVVVKPIRFEKR
jgi:hypothetical protein